MIKYIDLRANTYTVFFKKNKKGRIIFFNCKLNNIKKKDDFKN